MKERNEGKENTSVSGGAEAGQSAGVALKCGRGASPLPCSAVEAERKLQSGLAVDPAGRGCDSHQALQKNEESFSLTRQESNVHHLVDANKKPSDTVFSTAQSLSHVRLFATP